MNATNSGQRCGVARGEPRGSTRAWPHRSPRPTSRSVPPSGSARNVGRIGAALGRRDRAARGRDRARCPGAAGRRHAAPVDDEAVAEQFAPAQLAAGDRALLEHEHLLAGLGEVGGGRPGRCGPRRRSMDVRVRHRRAYRQSFRISVAASLPAAPMTPPPGCAPARTEVVARERRAEVGPLRRRAQEEELVQQQLAVEDVAVGDAGDALDVLRRDHLLADDRAGGCSARSARCVEITASPNASRFASFQPPSMSYGAYCTKHDITCCPGGAMSGSIIDGMIDVDVRAASRTGRTWRRRRRARGSRCSG